MAAGLIIGLLIVGGGVFFLVKKKKVPGLIMTIAGGVVALFGLIIMIGLIVTADYPDAEPQGNVAENALLDVVPLDGLTATEDRITYITNYVTIVVQADDESHPEDTISGKTEDGAQWSTTDRDGTEAIHMKVDDKDVVAKVEAKKDSDKKTNEKADAGKAAAAVAALVDTGYRKDKDNYNHNYSIWYVEPAQCLVYYPSQLELSEVKEDNTAIFTDKKSKAKLKISLDENNYSCMDDVESFIANTEYNKVLASGTDWFSCETKGKSMTEFSYTGLGQKFAVNVDLTYENKYDFVFEELRGLIKCQFVEGGKWVSNEVRDTTGKTVPALQNAYANGMKYKLTQWYFANGDFIQIYPNVFSKVYNGNDGTYFTDPVTGAYIKTFKQDYGSSIDALAIDYGLTDYTRIDEDIIRGYKDTEDYYKQYHFVVIRDGLEYHTIMYVPYAYDYLYQGAAAELSLKVPGDDVETFEMQDLYFKDYNCFVTVPLQFKFDKGGGSDYYYYDSFNGLDLHIKFWEIPDNKNTGNIFDIFDVTAEDSSLIVGQNTIKWHNDDGLFLGGQGNKTACYAEIVAVDAERAYLKSWDRFNVRFEEKAKAQSIVDEVKKDVKIQKIKDETINGKPGNNTAAATNTANNNTNNNESGQDEEKPKEETKPIIAEATNHELPDNDEWMDDDEANVVLWYKDYDDYNFMTTTARTWFLSEEGGAAYSHNYKWMLLAYMNVILKYNEYEVNVDNAWVERNAVPAVDAILEEWYYDCYPPVGSMMGDDITSVFEAYCQFLQIDVPDYVSNAMEPTVLDEGLEETEDSDQGYSSAENYTREDVAGIWAPDGSLGFDETYRLTKTGGYSIYHGDREVDSGYYTISGKVIYAQSFSKSSDDYDYWYFDPLMDQIIIKRYGHVLFRTGYLGDEDNDYSSDFVEGDDSYYISEDDFGEQNQGGYDNGEFQNADNGIGWSEDTEEYYEYDDSIPLYEEIAEEFSVEDVTDFGMAEYGNISYIYYYLNESDSSFSSGNPGGKLQTLVRELEDEGFTLDGVYSVDATHVKYLFAMSEDYMYALEYSGYVEGHEDLGLCHVVIVNDDIYGQIEVSWMFENYESAPMELNEGYVTSSFIKCINNVFLGKGSSASVDVNTIWFTGRLAAQITNDARSFLSDYYDLNEDYYFVLEADESSDPQWFGATAMDKNKNVLGKCMYRWNDEKESYILMHNYSGSWQNAWNY